MIVSGTPRPTVKYFHNDEQFNPENSDRFRFFEDLRSGKITFDIENVQSQDAGHYRVIIGNVHGTDEGSAYLRILSENCLIFIIYTTFTKKFLLIFW